MKRLMMWFFARRELRRCRKTGEYRLRKSNTGTYYVQQICRRKKKRYSTRDIVRIANHYRKNRHGHYTPPCKGFRHTKRQIIVKGVFRVEFYD